MFPSSTKREFRHFHVVVGQRRQRNVQKKRDARAKLLFCQSKPIALSPFSLMSPLSLLKLSNDDDGGGGNDTGGREVSDDDDDEDGTCVIKQLWLKIIIVTLIIV